MSSGETKPTLQRQVTELSNFEFDDELETKRDNSVLLEQMTIAFSEYIGTGLLVFVTCMGCTPGFYNGVLPPLQSSLVAGLAVMSMIQIFGHISGAYINPAITIAAVFMKQIKWSRACIYFTAQVSGALTGYALLMILTPDEHLGKEHCVTLPSEKVTIAQAIMVEIVVTGILALGCCAAWDCKNSKHTDSAGLRIGLIVAVLALAAGPYTGASMNPARSIGPAIWNSNLTNHYVYWLGPCLGGAIAGYFYNLILLK